MRCAALLATVAALTAGCASTYDWPDTARAADGLGIRYEEHGEGEPALVFVHAWSCDRQFWTYQVGPFSKSRHVVTVDLAGHGESERGRMSWTIEGLGDDVARVCERAELGHVVLVGHSMGAAVALEAARILGPRCTAVVAVDALADVDRPMTDDVREKVLEPLRADFAKATNEAVRGGAFTSTAEPSLVDLVATRISAQPPAIALPLIDAHLRFDVARALELVSCPVHCIQGASVVTNVESGRRHNARFDAETIEGVGRFGMLEDPQRFNRALADYLTRL